MSNRWSITVLLFMCGIGSFELLESMGDGGERVWLAHFDSPGIAALARGEVAKDV
jgi:hypothetical protein